MPGTPTDSPERRASSNASGFPVAGSMNCCVVQDAGQVSRPSSVTTRCSRAR
ncbi:MAG: hypothetical protein QOJ78_1827 [Pseudonocardiales bacterium]|nr:hypothetical protein [Pseudonocardiales bacterium]